MKTEHQRYMEMQVDVRRHHTSPEMTADLEYMIIRRSRQLRNESRAPATLVRAPLGAEQTLESIGARMRAFDVWVHEQDLRSTLGTGQPDSPGALVARDVLVQALPQAIAQDAAAPAELGDRRRCHRSCRVHAHGPGGRGRPRHRRGTPRWGP